MSFQQYLLDHLKRVIHVSKGKSVQKILKDPAVQEMIEKCLNLGCLKEDIEQTIKEALDDKRFN